MIGKAHTGGASRLDGPPAIVERTGEVHECGIRIGKPGRELAAEPQPREGAARRVSLRSGGAARAEPTESGTN